MGCKHKDPKSLLYPPWAQGVGCSNRPAPGDRLGPYRIISRQRASLSVWIVGDSYKGKPNSARKPDPGS